MAKKPLSFDNALERAAAWCSRAEHSRLEIIKKLRRLGVTPDVAEKVAERLEENGFIDEERFARAFVYDKSRFEYWGRTKIRYQLRQLGVSAAVAESALEEIDEEEYVRNLTMLLHAKFRSLPDSSDPYKQKNALYRYAMTRGFESRHITPIVTSLIKGADDFEDSLSDDSCD